MFTKDSHRVGTWRSLILITSRVVSGTIQDALSAEAAKQILITSRARYKANFSTLEPAYLQAILDLTYKQVPEHSCWPTINQQDWLDKNQWECEGWVGQFLVVVLFIELPRAETAVEAYYQERSQFQLMDLIIWVCNKYWCQTRKSYDWRP